MLKHARANLHKMSVDETLQTNPCRDERCSLKKACHTGSPWPRGGDECSEKWADWPCHTSRALPTQSCSAAPLSRPVASKSICVAHNFCHSLHSISASECCLQGTILYTKGSLEAFHHLSEILNMLVSECSIKQQRTFSSSTKWCSSACFSCQIWNQHVWKLKWPTSCCSATVGNQTCWLWKLSS